MSFQRLPNIAMFPSASGVRALIAPRGSCAGNRGRPGKCYQVGEHRARQPAVAEHLDVEPIDDVMLLAEKQRAVAMSNSSQVAAAASGVDLPPGRECGEVDDARMV